MKIIDKIEGVFVVVRLEDGNKVICPREMETYAHTKTCT